MANPSPGTRRRQSSVGRAPMSSITLDQMNQERKRKKGKADYSQVALMKAEKRLRDPGAQSGGMGVGIDQGRAMTPYRSGVYR